jgi:lipopolysaccharide export system permease protein
LPDSARYAIIDRVKENAMSIKGSAESMAMVEKDRSKVLRKHKIEWHRKITLSIACLVLFLIGAPLGSIIRKGGWARLSFLQSPFLWSFIFQALPAKNLLKKIQ